MKSLKLLFLIFCTAITYYTKATVWTVDNNPNSSAMFASLQKAIDGALAGDTIYVNGSKTNYGDITIDKKIHLIGAGFRPATASRLPAGLDEITLTEKDALSNVSNATGSIIEGFQFNSIYIKNVSIGIIQDIQLKRSSFNYVSLASEVSNIIIVNNIIDGSVSSTSSSSKNTNIHIKNNVFKNGAYIYSFHTNTLVIANNLFISEFNNNSLFSSVEDAVIQNNIFFGSMTLSSYAKNCHFINNLSFGKEYLSFDFGTTHTGEDNIENQDPLFENEDDYTFNWKNVYRLQVGSPGKNKGTDNTDIGIYGGSYPFPSGGSEGFVNCPLPEIPQIWKFDVLNSTVTQGGTIDINLKASKPE